MPAGVSSSNTQTEPGESGSDAHFGLRHLVGLTAVAGGLLAIAAPAFRRLGPGAQLDLALRWLALSLAVLAAVASILVLRSRVERNAGPLIQRFERNASRLSRWFVAVALIGWYLVTLQPDVGRGQVGNLGFPGSPLALFFAVNFLVVRVWWRIDPLGIEARGQGLILGAFRLVPWTDIARYTRSGAPAHQLNLYLRQRLVLNLKVDPPFAEPLGQILDAQVAGLTFWAH